VGVEGNRGRGKEKENKLGKFQSFSAAERSRKERGNCGNDLKNQGTNAVGVKPQKEEIRTSDNYSTGDSRSLKTNGRGTRGRLRSASWVCIAGRRVEGEVGKKVVLRQYRLEEIGKIAGVA